jgi:hypothetical protein
MLSDLARHYKFRSYLAPASTVCGAAHCQHPGGIKTSCVADIEPAHGLRYHNFTHDRVTVTIVTRKKNAAENRGVMT